MAGSGWFYLDENDQQVGPISSAALRQRAAAGKLKPTDLIWRDGLKDWVEARKVSGLFSAEGKSSPPAPPAKQPAPRAPAAPRKTESKPATRPDPAPLPAEDDGESIFSQAVESLLDSPSTITNPAPGAKGKRASTPAAEDRGSYAVSEEEPPAAPRGLPSPGIYGGLPKKKQLVEAPWVSRLIAFWIDQFVINIVAFIAAFVTFLLCLAVIVKTSTPGTRPPGIYSLGPAILVFFGVNILYYAGMESSPLGATLGKLALGIKVCRIDGGQVSFGHATGRYLVMLFTSMLGIIALILALLNPNKQWLHDSVTGCTVVRK